MKILHTADWHLGASIEGRSRRDEQQKIIDEVVSIAEQKNVDIVLIAGDIFSGATAPDYADHMFADALLKLSKDGNRAVVAITGNNDLADRFIACREFAQKQNIFLFNSLNANIRDENIAFDKDIKLISYGKGFVELEKKDEKTVVCVMPYPNFFGDEITRNKEETLLAKTRRLFALSALGFKEDAFNIAMAHFFVPNKESTSDFYFEFPLDILPADADYVAMGHIHDANAASEERNVYYSGSTIDLFYETKRKSYSVTVLTTEGHKISNKEIIKLNSPISLMKIEAKNIAEAQEKLNKISGCYIKVILNECTQEEFRQLKIDYPSIVSISIKPKALKKPNEAFSNKINDEMVFKEFYKKLYKREPNARLMSCYLSLMKDEGGNE